MATIDERLTAVEERLAALEAEQAEIEERLAAIEAVAAVTVVEVNLDDETWERLAHGTFEPEREFNIKMAQEALNRGAPVRTVAEIVDVPPARVRQALRDGVLVAPPKGTLLAPLEDTPIEAMADDEVPPGLVRGPDFAFEFGRGVTVDPETGRILDIN